MFEESKSAFEALLDGSRKQRERKAPMPSQTSELKVIPGKIDKKGEKPEVTIDLRPGQEIWVHENGVSRKATYIGPDKEGGYTYSYRKIVRVNGGLEKKAIVKRLTKDEFVASIERANQRLVKDDFSEKEIRDLEAELKAEEQINKINLRQDKRYALAEEMYLDPRYSQNSTLLHIQDKADIGEEWALLLLNDIKNGLVKISKKETKIETKAVKTPETTTRPTPIISARKQIEEKPKGTISKFLGKLKFWGK